MIWFIILQSCFCSSPISDILASYDKYKMPKELVETEFGERNITGKFWQLFLNLIVLFSFEMFGPTNVAFRRWSYEK